MAAAIATVRPGVAHSPRTPGSPLPTTVTWSSETRAAEASQVTSTPGPGPLATTLDSSAAPPRTTTRPNTSVALTDAPSSICTPPSTRTPAALLPASCSRSAGPDPVWRSRVASAPTPSTRTGRPAASANGPSAVSRPSRIVSRSGSARAAAKASAAVSFAVQPAVRMPTQ